MMKIFANVPKDTIPYKCGERLMACIVTDTLELEKCVEFFKTKEDAKEWQKTNPDFHFKGEK